MFHQASLQQIRSGELTREEAYLVVCMAHYPRGLAKPLIDEFRNNLAPDPELFNDWKHAEAEVGHDAAFARVNYESRFQVSSAGLESLRRLADVARARAVHLVCQCELGARCHRELLLLTIKAKLHIPTGPVHNAYPIYEQRLLTP